MARCSAGQGCCYFLLSPQLRYFFHYFPHREGLWAATTGFDMDDQQLRLFILLVSSLAWCMQSILQHGLLLSTSWFLARPPGWAQRS